MHSFLCFLYRWISSRLKLVFLQFLYGEDGLDICKSQYLKEEGIPFLVANQECIRRADEQSLSSDPQAREDIGAAQESVSK